MVLAGKLVAQTEVKASGDVFHDILANRPHHMTDMTSLIHNVNLVEGQWGTTGTVVHFHYTNGGKKEKALTTIESIDEEKQFVKYKICEGDLMDKYRNFSISLHVEKKNEEIKLITWTCEYEKLNNDVPEPFSFMEYVVGVTKHIEAHHA